MKKCNKCDEIKPLSEFHKRTDGCKDNHKYMCKKCEHIAHYNYSKTKSGHITRMLIDQKTRSKNRGHDKPTYTNSEFREWILNESKYHTLYAEWEKNDYNKWLAPSVDRLDNTKTYSFDNIRIVSWKDNHISGNNSRKRKIEQYDLELNLLNTYSGVREASRKIGKTHPAIVACCKGNYKQAYGFIWKYKGEE